MSNHKKSVIYSWSPNCGSSSCIPLFRAQKICDEQDIKLYVLLEYYDAQALEFQGQIRNPILAMNHKHYKSNFANKVGKRFRQDLLNQPIKDTLSWYRFLYFEGGNFISASRELR